MRGARGPAGSLSRVTLRLFDSLTRELRDFVPVVPGKAGIYICGLTTQAPPHIGHVRFAVAFDVLRRWLAVGHGYDTSFSGTRNWPSGYDTTTYNISTKSKQVGLDEWVRQR